MSVNESLSFTTTTNSFGEKYIFELNQSLFEKIDSYSVFTSKFGKDFLQTDSFYIFCGTDSSLLVDYVIKVGIPKTSKVIFVELDEVKSWLDQNRLVDSLPDNLAIVALNQLANQLTAFDINAYILLDKLFFIPSLSSQFSYYPPYAEFSDKILTYIKTLHWNIRIDLDRKDFIIGQLENISENQHSISILEKSFQGQTAVLLAGGPSLDDILPWVKENRENIIIFAVSRIAKRLLKAGITPHFFVTVHTQPISFDVSKEMLLFHEDSILLSHAQACPHLISQWQGRHFFMGDILPWKSELNGPSQELAGPTVSHAAFDIIIKMGFSTIVLGGVDLCFSPRDKSHASGSVEFDQTSQSEGGDVRIETNGGKVAETTHAFHRGIIEFSRMAGNARKKGCKIYNPSLLSAQMEGVELVDLSNVSPSQNCSDIFKKFSAFDSNTFSLQHYSTVLAELEKITQICAKLRSLALQGFIESIELLHKIERQGLDKKDLIVVSQLTGEIQAKEYSFVFQVVHSFGIRFFATLSLPVNDLEESNQDSITIKKLYFTALIVSIDKLGSVLKNSVKRVLSRIEEESKTPNLSQITQQWLEDNQPGRSLKFLSKRKDFLFDTHAPWSTVFSELKNRFEKLIYNSESLSIEQQTKSEWDLARLQKLRERIYSAYSSKDTVTLEKIISSLMESKKSATLLSQYLAKGLNCELTGDMHGAIAYYNKIIEENDREQLNLLEDGLSRIASISISLQDMPNAELALQCLADISPGHCPKLAEFLHISGKTDQALEVYAEYLGKVPDDLETMLKLGQIYKDLNSMEGIKMVTDYVLERDPANKTARNLQDYHQKNFPSA